MALTLACIEGSSLFLVVCGTIFLWAQPILLDWIDVATVLGQAFALVVCCITSFYYNDLYDLRIVRNFGEFASRLLQSFGVAFILLAAFYAMFPETKIAGGPFASSLLFIVGLLLPLRAVCYAMMRRRLLAERVLILGTSPLAYSIIEEIEAQPHFRQTIVGVADDAVAPEEPAPRYPLLGPLAHFAKIIEEVQPDRIVVAMAERRGRLPVRQLLESQIHGIIVEDGVEVYERLTGKAAIESLMPGSFIFSQDLKKARRRLALRRVINVVVAAIGLTFTAPLMTIITLLVRLDSGGPIFFVQDRVGHRGLIFRLIKFRTMQSGTTEGTYSVWQRDDTLRVTRIGKWLRKLRLDELPQFINILRGDMDLIGPRPEMACNVETMSEQIPYYFLRSRVRPGITGWAQIKFGYAVSQEDVTEKLRYDLYYIKHMSFWFDLRILIDTLKIVLFGRGAQ